MRARSQTRSRVPPSTPLSPDGSTAPEMEAPVAGSAIDVDGEVASVEPAADLVLMADVSQVSGATEERAPALELLADGGRGDRARVSGSAVEAAHGIERCLGGDSAKPPARSPVPPTRMAANTALDALLAEGILSADEVHSRRSRLVAVGEAGPRLRSLLELHQANLLTDAQLATRRAEIIAPLACVLKGAESAG